MNLTKVAETPSIQRSNSSPFRALRWLPLFLALAAWRPAHGAETAVASPPAVFWHADPVMPGEIALLEGAGFGEKALVEIARLGDGPPGEPGMDAAAPVKDGATIAPWQQSASSLKFPVAASAAAGIFGCRVVAGDLGSKWVFLNEPQAWWLQGDWGKEASPGGWLRVFGRCLSFENKATVVLRRDGKTALKLAPMRQECWSLHLELPKDMAAGEYEVWVHNGHGGPAGWRKAGGMRVAAHTSPWKPDVFDVTAYGAHPNGGFDDSLPVQKALDAAGANGGGIVHFPRGKYLLQRTLELPRGVLLRGAGRDMTQIYWTDRAEPLPSLIHGADAFGIEDMTIMAANHSCGIVSDENKEDGAGNIFLRRLYVNLNAFQHISIHGQHDGREFIARTWPIRFHGHAINLGGENVQVTDCDVFSSYSPLSFHLRWGFLRGSRFFVGSSGAWPLGAHKLIFEDNEVAGGPMARGTGEGGEHWYFARNKVGMMCTADSEAFTTDGGQRAEVKIASAAGTTVMLAEKPNWEYAERTVGGLRYLYITDGLGVGQVRRMTSHGDLSIELDEPWDLPPDKTSAALLSFCNLKFLMIGNTFHDAGIVASYTWAKDWVFAGNRLSRCGGINVWGRGKSPSEANQNWHTQVIGNEILAGNGWRTPNNMLPPSDMHLQATGGGVRGIVFRNNVLRNNALINAIQDASGILIEGNTIANADAGVMVDNRCTGVMIRNNCFEKVLHPLNVPASVWTHPAERLLAGAEAAAQYLPAGSGALPTGWERTLTRVRELVGRDASATETQQAVGQCQEELLKLAAAWKVDGYPMEFLRELARVSVECMPDKPLQGVFGASSGGSGTVRIAATLPNNAMSKVRLDLEFGGQPEVQVEAAREFVLEPGKGGARNLKVTVRSGIGGAPTVPVKWNATGMGWTLGGQGRLNLSRYPMGMALDQWWVCGPFPNATRGRVDEDAVYGPERCLNPSTRFKTMTGQRGWEEARTSVVDFTQLFGDQDTACAYALTVLRARKAMAARIKLLVALDAGFYYLNGRQIYRHMREVHGQACTLDEGDNILMAKVANDGRKWQVEGRVEVPDWAAPGDIQVVPVSEFGGVAALKAQAKPQIPEGTQLPNGNGLDWKLAWDDDFDRAKLGTEWKTHEGKWVMSPYGAPRLYGGKDGALEAQGRGAFMYLSFDRRVRPPARVEFDVQRLAEGKGKDDLLPIGQMLAVTLTKANEVQGRRLWRTGQEVKGYGYMLCLGWHNRRSNEVWRESAEVAVSTDAPQLNKADGWHHVVAQFTPKKMTLWLDGQRAAEFAEDKWLPDLDTLSFFAGFAHVQLDNIRIYEAAAR